MKFKLLIPFLLIASFAFASSLNENKKIDIARSKYQLGYYEECILAVNKFCTPSYFSKFPDYASEAFSLKAGSYFRLANYQFYSETVSELSDLINGNIADSTKLKTRFKLAQLYLEVGNIKGCDSLLSLIITKNDSSFQEDIQIVKSGVLFSEGNISEARRILSGHIALLKAKENFEKRNNLLFFNNIKTTYAKCILDKIKILIVQGELDSANVYITLHKNWLDKNLSSGQYYYRELDRLSGELEISRNNTEGAYDEFLKSYQYSQFSDGEFQKIKILSSLIILSNQLGQTDQSQKLLRRLQMLAYVSSGRQEPFQFEYEKTLIEIAIESNNYSSANDRLLKFSNSFNSFPSWDPVKIEFSKLESELLLFRPKANVNQLLDSVISQSEYDLGESNDYIASLLIKKISYNIHYGNGIEEVGKDLKKLNDNFISKGYAGAYLLQYLELSSLYYQILDDFKMSKDYAEKAYKYSSTLYGAGSEKRIYYHAIYLKNLLYARSYKEFYSQFDQLKNSFNSNNWFDKEEKRKSYLVIADIYELIGDKDDNKGTLIGMMKEMTESGTENVYSKSRIESELAYIYLRSGNLYKAEKFIRHSIESKSSLLSANSVAFIEDLFFLSQMELQKGNFKETEKNIESAGNIISKAYGKNSRLYAEYLKLHADYCISLGDYKRANEYIASSQKIILEKSGKEDLTNISLLVLKAYILSQEDTDKLNRNEINSLYIESLSLLSETIGKENFFYMDVLKKNANFLVKIKELTKADSMLTVTETYWKKRLGNENQELLEVYLLKGDIFYEKDDYKKASSYYEDVKKIASSIFDTKNNYYTQAYARQARVAFMQQKPDQAFSIMEELLPLYLNIVSKNFPTLSFREKSKYWSNMRGEFEFYVFLVLNNKELTEKYSRNVFNNVISTKAILLYNNIKIRENILASKDSVLINAYNDWIDLKEYFISVSSLTKSELEEQKIDLKSIETEIERREKILSNKSESFKAEDKISNATLKDIASILSPNEYAVEVVRYRNFYKHFTDTINYAALIVNRNSISPDVVVFEHGNEFETSALKRVRNSARYFLKDKNSYNLFWKPLTSFIPDRSTVYLSSEGAFNQFNMEMLADSLGNFLLDKIELVQVTNTKELLRNTYHKESQKSSEVSSQIVLSGSPDFYLESKTPESDKEIEDLPGAATEVEQISNVLRSGNLKVIKVMGDSLTEDWVKEINSPRVFHIATHGYYSEPKNGDDEDNALLNSGLLLTGAGDILSEEKHVNSQDGILTAYEAMNLKLDHTDLVVLSACETGLGEVKAGEGVYGLQRSFLIAGSKTIVISLFKVNDEVTQKLMKEFYSNWLKSGDIRKSFITAKQKIKNEYPDKPIYWGAFVLIEGQPELKKESGKKSGRM